MQICRVSLGISSKKIENLTQVLLFDVDNCFGIGHGLFGCW